MQAVYSIGRRTSQEVLDEVALKIGRPGSKYDSGFYYSFPRKEDEKHSACNEFTQITVAVRNQKDARDVCEMLKEFLGNDVRYGLCSCWLNKTLLRVFIPCVLNLKVAFTKTLDATFFISISYINQIILWEKNEKRFVRWLNENTSK